MKYSTMNYAIYDEGNATYTLKVCLSNSIFSTNYRLNNHARAKMIINHQEVGDNYICEMAVKKLVDWPHVITCYLFVDKCPIAYMDTRKYTRLCL